MEASLPMIRSAVSKIAPCAAGLALLGFSGVASAQSIIKQPGNHPDYSFEIEPHLAFEWARDGYDEGIGPGARVNIPFMHNGPIKTINNNMGISFGLDITFGDGGPGWCYSRYDRDQWLAGRDCDLTEFWLPVAMQWNFFLTKVISVFGEPGFAIVHQRWDYDYRCASNPDGICPYDDDDTDVRFIFGGGGRFMFSDSVGATVRIGFPMITAGINILL
jgi:hypothetical protein